MTQQLLDVGSFLGSSQVVRPSGDATGATDATNINAALAGSASSVYLNGGYTVNATITIPSNKTLILADAKITLAAAANVPIIANPSFASASTPAASNIHIRGIGRAVLDYNGANQTEQTSAIWNSSIIVFTNVTTFSIKDIQTQNSQFLHIWTFASNDGVINGVHGAVGATDKGFIHTDTGSTNIKVSNITSTGTWADAVFSLQVGNDPTAFGTVPYAVNLTGSARNVTGISWSDIILSSSTGMFVFYVDNSGSILDIDINNVHNTYTGTATGQEIEFGPSGYDLQSLAANGSMAGFRINGYTFGGTNHVFMTLDSPLTDCLCTNLRATTGVQGLIGHNPNTGSGITSGALSQVARIKFTDVNIPTLQSGGALSGLVAGYKANDIEFENITIGTANAPLLKNSSDITGLSLSKIRVGTLNSNPFQSTGNEIGVISDLTYDQKGLSLTAILPVATSLKIQPPFPALASADATPRPVHGSDLLCYTTKDPTGGSSTTGGRYNADGKGWNLVTSGNSIVRPGQIYQPLLFHYDAAAILGLSNGASVARWPDSATNLTLVQATSANQPTWNASDAHLNGLPSVSFNGSSQFIQTASLTPISVGQPYTIFIVYYLTTITAGKYIFDASTTTNGSDGPIYYEKTTTATGFTPGGASVQGTVTLATNTAYIGCCDMTSGTAHLGENKAALSSLAGAGSTDATIKGFTLGANYNGSANYAAVTVAEAFAYQGLISSTDYATIAAGLAAKYGVTLT